MIDLELSFRHLARLSDRTGTLASATGTTPDPAGGYRTTDMARLLVVTSREPGNGTYARSLTRLALQFLARAQCPDGTVLDGIDASGEWVGPSAFGESWGSALWALGTAAARVHDVRTRVVALELFQRSARGRPVGRRAAAYALLGAAEAVDLDDAARALIADALDVIGASNDEERWPWPEARLAHVNAVVPDALMAAGTALDRSDLTDQGLALLEWLLAQQIHKHHLSVIPADGAGRRRAHPAFDQLPVEVATLADAFARARATSATGAPAWTDALRLTADWFTGGNDVGATMFDTSSGGGYDRLTAEGASPDQGAAATLALVGTLQHARTLPRLPL